METTFFKLIREQNFEGASCLLKDALKKAELIHPRKEDTWVPMTDTLGFSIMRSLGAGAYSIYWDDLLHFFEKELEPSWGHLYKGHILFRLGFGHFSESAIEARHDLDRALSEDIRHEEEFQQEIGFRRPLLETLSRFPSYLVLCFLDLIKDEHFTEDGEKARFYRGMAAVRWDAILGAKGIDPDIVTRAVERLLTPEGSEKVFKVRHELDIVLGEKLSAAAVMLCRLVAETVLFCLLGHKHKVKHINGTELMKADLHAMISETNRMNLFASDAVYTAFKSVALAANNLYRRRVDCSRYTEQVESGLANSLRALLENAIVEWGLGGAPSS